MDINKIIDIIRSLKEEAPTMSVSGGGIAGLPPDDPPVFKKKKKKYIYGGKGSRKMWM
jgi:hypothetical protein